MKINFQGVLILINTKMFLTLHPLLEKDKNY